MTRDKLMESMEIPNPHTGQAEQERKARAAEARRIAESKAFISA